MSPRRQFGLMIFSLAIIGFGFWLAPGDFEHIGKAIDSVKWPTAKATITAGNIEQTGHSSRGRGRYETWQWRVSYTYKIGNQQYRGERISYATAADHGTEDRALVDQLAGRFAVGTEHEAHYNPKDPADAVLIAGVQPEEATSASYLVFVLGFAFLITSLYNLTSLRTGIGPNRAVSALLLTVLCVGGYFSQPFLVRLFVPPSTVISLTP